MINLKNLTLRRGVKVVLDSASVTLNPGEKVGLVGRNGAGKSSLFSLLAGRLQADGGDFEIPPRWRLGEVVQSMPETEDPATEYVLQGDIPLVEAQALLAAAEAAEDGHAMAEAYVHLEEAGAFDARSRAQTLLLGLGFRRDQLDAPVNSFSGGWRMRLQLARALMCPADLMLLDEPTNHLDLDALVWLEGWLQRYNGTLLIISHDREFLDAITRVTLHLDDAKLTRYGGNYTTFEEMRAERMSQQAAAYGKQQERMAHLQRFIDRFKAKASKAKQAQSRVKALDRMEKLAPVMMASDFNFEFREPASLPDPMLSLRDMVCGYIVPPVAGYGDAPPEGVGPALGRPGAGAAASTAALPAGDTPPEGVGPALGRPGAGAAASTTGLPAGDTPPKGVGPALGRRGAGAAASTAGLPAGAIAIVHNINRTVMAGQRIGILGANGQGKSTLVKTIARENPSLAGTVTEGKGLAIGYFAQQEMDLLHADDTPMQHMVRLAKTLTMPWREQELRDFLGQFRFVGDMVNQSVGTLSGGEKARLVLASLVWQRPNLLLLDEPTNHLDLTTREALSMALNEFEGSVMLVSHDRALLREVCDEFWLVADGVVKNFDGDLDDYQKWLLDRSREAARALSKAGAPPPPAAAPVVAKVAAPAAASAPRPAAAPIAPREDRKASSQARAKLAEKTKPLRQQVERIDKQLAMLAAERVKLEGELASGKLAGTQLAEHGKRLKQIADDTAKLEERWLALQDEIEAVTAQGD